MTTTAILKSYYCDEHSAIVSVNGSDVVLRLCCSDRLVVAHLSPGQKIEFDFAKDRDGALFAIDVAAVRFTPESRSRGGSAMTDRVAQSAVPKRSSKSGGKETQSEQPRASQPHVTLEELLSSCVVRQMMERDCVDAEDIRRLFALMSNLRPADHG